MKISKLLVFSLLSISLASCNIFNRGGSTNNSSSMNSSSSSSNNSSSRSSSSSGSSSSSSSSSSNSSSSSSSSELDPDDERRISLNKKELILLVSKYEYLTVDFFPSQSNFSKEIGTWNTSNSAVAEVSEHGKVTGKSKGSAVISYTTVEGFIGYCTVHIVNSMDDITREYLRVDDMDSIKVGDQIVFGCPEFGIVASLNRQDRYLLPVNSLFNGDGSKITSLGVDAAEFYVGEGKEGSLTLENQANQYLAGKETSVDTTLLFINSTKGQIDWIFERYEENNYCVNFDIANDYWLMFNKINDGDFRFNLYDSNPGTLMKLPTIYRLTITSFQYNFINAPVAQLDKSVTLRRLRSCVQIAPGAPMSIYEPYGSFYFIN